MLHELRAQIERRRDELLRHADELAHANYDEREIMAGEIEVSAGPVAPPLTIEQVAERTALVHTLLADVLKRDIHYGTIPGCGEKLVLLKPGAEKLAMLFQLWPRITEKRIDLPDEHREYETTVELIDVTGRVVSMGVGVCSSRESKYRYRTGPGESTGEVVPREYWERRKLDPLGAQKILGGAGHGTAKVDGVWMITDRGGRIEHDNPPDHCNTIRKMAAKRAFIHAVVTATAAGDIFTQDLDDDPDLAGAGPGDEPKRPQSKRANGAKRSDEQDSADYANTVRNNQAAPTVTDGNGGNAVRLATKAQVGRFFAKCKNGPRTDEEVSDELARRGFASGSEIPFGKAYDDFCEWADGK